MHKVKDLWNRIIFREEVEPETVFENRLSLTEVKDGYLNLSNMNIPSRYFIDEEIINVVMIDVKGLEEQPVIFRCQQRKTHGKKGKVFKRQRFWPIDFGLKEWFHKQKIESGDIILMAISLKSRYLIFRAIRPKTLLMLNDRRLTERRDLERRFEDRRQTIIHVAVERRKKDRRRNERRAIERRNK